MTRRWSWAIIPVAQAVAGAVALRRIARGARRLPALVAQPRTRMPPGLVSVVIPARDEQDRIGPCLAALAADPQVGEVIVVDDESSDATAREALAGGAQVVAGRPLPPGWVGKPWALQQGLSAARGEWVLALDADVVPRPGLVGALVGAAVDHGWDVVSAAPRFVCRGGAERWLHASMLATILYRFGPPGPRMPPPPHRAIGNGQCLLVRRRWLADRGGFAVTGGHLTDDIALLRWLSALGGAVGFVDGSHVVEVEMHRSAGEVWREWGRSLPMPDVTPPLWQAGDLAVVWLTMALPVLRLLTRRTTAVDVVLTAVRLGTVVALRSSYAEGGPPVWLSWLADPAVALRLTQGALHPTRSWRGRTYPWAPPPGHGPAGGTHLPGGAR